MKRDQCRTCRAPIVWARTSSGKAMPVDWHPTPAADGGNVELTDNGPWAAPDAVVLGPLEIPAATGPLHLSHFATCPQADQHRKATA